MKQIISSIFIMLVMSGSLLTKSVVHQITPQDLFVAVEVGSRKAVNKMLSKGVGVNTLNAQGKTVLDIAIERGDIKIARDLASYGARVTTERNAEILRDNFKLRALTYFLCGWLFMPLLWIGTIVSLYKASNVMVMIKPEDEYLDLIKTRAREMSVICS